MSRRESMSTEGVRCLENEAEAESYDFEAAALRRRFLKLFTGRAAYVEISLAQACKLLRVAPAELQMQVDDLLRRGRLVSLPAIGQDGRALVYRLAPKGMKPPGPLGAKHEALAFEPLRPPRPRRGGAGSLRTAWSEPLQEVLKLAAEQPRICAQEVVAALHVAASSAWALLVTCEQAGWLTSALERHELGTVRRYYRRAGSAHPTLHPGVTPARRAVILAAVVERGSLTAREIEPLLGCSESTARLLMSSMERAGDLVSNYFGEGTGRGQGKRVYRLAPNPENV